MKILQAANLWKEFESGQEKLTILEDVSFEIEAGESAAIVGPSGSGKSTLLSLLAGLDRPTRGEVAFNGRNLGKISENGLTELWGKEIGFIFQNYYLLPTLTALENVRVPLELAGRGQAEEIAREWLAKVGLAERLHHPPAKLSGGEQQRAALARALAPGPKILFADEPTGNLDNKTGQEMMALILSLVKDRATTLVLVTHEIPFAAKTNRILELKAGRLRPAP